MEIFELPNVEIDCVTLWLLRVTFLGRFGFQGLFSLIIYTEGANILYCLYLIRPLNLTKMNFRKNIIL